MRKFLLTILILFGIVNQLTAQSSCERNLNEARADYNSGNLYAVPGKLGDCLEEGFTKSEKITALRLLTLTYININQQEKAKTTLIKLLNLQTDYQVIANVDPSELYSLYESIDTDIKYFIGLTVGLNFNSIQPKLIRTTNPLGNHDPNYSANLGFPQIGLQFLYPIRKSLIARGEIQYQNQRFSYSEVNDYDENNISRTSYESNNTGLNLNLMLRYMKDYYSWKPFVEFGTTARLNLSYDVVNYLGTFDITVDEENITREVSIYSDRVNFNYALNASLGSMIKIRENYVEVKFGISNYLRNHLTKEARRNAVKTTLLNAMVIKEDDYTNLVYQVDFTFNIPFFNFQ